MDRPVTPWKNTGFTDVAQRENSPLSSCTKVNVKTTEETLAELRRENFRLRLICFEYEKSHKRSADPQDADYSHLFSVEAENFILQEKNAENAGLLRSASKIIDNLKEENDFLTDQLTDCKKKLDEGEHEWQNRYDDICAQLREARDAVRSGEMRLLSQERESNKQMAEFQNRISTLEADLQLKETELELNKRKLELLHTHVDLSDSILAERDLDCHPPKGILKEKQDHTRDLRNSDQTFGERNRVMERLNAVFSSFHGSADVTQHTLSSVGDFLELSAPEHYLSDVSVTNQPPVTSDLDVQEDAGSENRLSTLALVLRTPVGIPHNASVHNAIDSPSVSSADPGSLNRLRDLYNLVNGLISQLDSVRFTQRSFVEMVNRSLCTSGLDPSILFSPGKRNDSVSLNAGVDRDVGVSLRNTSNAGPVTDTASATATCGETRSFVSSAHITASKPLDACFEPDQSAVADKTLSELRIYPSSPAKEFHSSLSRSVIPIAVSKGSIVPSLSALKIREHAASLSFTEGVPPRNPLPPSINLHPLSINSSSHRPHTPPCGPIGDLTMVEWQNKDLFERLAHATAKLRDALEECAEVSSQIWNEDLSQCLSCLSDAPNADISSPARVCPEIDRDSHVPSDATLEHTPELVRPVLDCSLTGPNRSVRFDHPDPNLASGDFGQLSAESSLGQLYGSAWHVSDSSWSEKVSNKISVNTQTSSKPISSLQTSESSETITLHRFVSLLTHALAVLHQTVEESIFSEECNVGASNADWLVSWTKSANHWFQSYLNAVAGCDDSASSDTVTQSAADVDNLDRRLESLERVFNEHINDWITELFSRSKQLQLGLADIQKRNEQLSTEAAVKNDNLKRVNDENDRLKEMCDDLRDQLAQVRGKSGPMKNSPTENQHLLPYVNETDHSTDAVGDVLGVDRCTVGLTARNSKFDGLVIHQVNLDDILNKLRSSSLPVPPDGSLDACVDSLLTELDRIRGELGRLSNDYVLRTEYDKVLEESAELATQVEEIRLEQASQRKYIQERLYVLDSDVPSEDIVDCVDILLTEFARVRDAADLLEAENSKLRSKLDHSIPLTEHDKIQQQLEKRFFLEREEAVDIIACIVEVPDRSASLANCMESVKSLFLTYKCELIELRSERQKIVSLLEDMNIPGELELIANIEAVLTSLLDKQRALSDLEDMHAQLQSSLKNYVPREALENNQAELLMVRDELDFAKSKASEMETEMEDLIRSTVTLNDHQAVLIQLRTLEKQLTDLQTLNLELESQREHILSVISGHISCVGETDLVNLIEKMCDQLQLSEESLQLVQQRYDHVVTECDGLRQDLARTEMELHQMSDNVKQQSAAEIFAIRSEMTRKLTEQATECHRRATELDGLAHDLASVETERDRLIELLQEARHEVSQLRASLTAQSQSAEAAASAASAHEERADILSTQLMCLKEEHALCSSRPSLVSVQTSPIHKSKSADEMSDVLASQPSPLTVDHSVQNAARLRKYGELKSVAFEIKEKLINRTEKLEVALTEVARLRSVIQQDKQRASRVLEEVEDLRKQALKKNRKIRDLETELAKFKPLANPNPHPVSSAKYTGSSARTISDVELPRGSQCRPVISEICRNLIESPAASFNRPISPIHYSNHAQDLAAHPESTALLYNSSLSLPERDSAVLPNKSTDSARCRRCEELHNLVVSLQNLSCELQHRVDVDLHEEYSLMATLNNVEQPSNRLPHAGTTAAHRSNSLTNVLLDASVQVNALGSFGSSCNDLRANIQSLHIARSKLAFYAGEVDRICSSVADRLRTREKVDDCTSSFDPQYGSTRQLVRSLVYIYKQLKACIVNIETPSASATVSRLAADLKVAIRSLLSETGLRMSRSLDRAKTEENKENTVPSIRHTELPESEVESREFAKRAERYERRCRALAQGLDLMTKELSDTTDMLSAARGSLERTGAVEIRR